MGQTQTGQDGELVLVTQMITLEWLWAECSCDNILMKMQKLVYVCQYPHNRFKF